MSWGQGPPDQGGDDQRRDPAPEWGRDPASGPPPPPPGAGGPDQSWGHDAGPPPSGWGNEPATDRLRPMNLGDVLDGMFRLAIAHWRAFAIAIGVIVVPLSILSTLVTTLTVGTVPGFTEILQDAEVQSEFVTGSADVESLAAAGAAAAVAGLVAVLLTPLVYGVATHVAAVGYRDGDVEPMDSVRTAASRYLPLLGTTIMIGLIPVLIFLVPTVIVAIGAGAGIDALTVIGVVGFLVSLFLAVVVSVRLAVSVPALMVERFGPVQALKRSNELVKGRTGMTFGILLVAYIIVTIIGIVLSLPFNAVGAAVGDATGSVLTTLGQILSGLVQNTLLGAALVLIYFDRRVRTEGYDLTQLAGELGDRRDQAW